MSDSCFLRHTETGGYVFYCPGCKSNHIFYVEKPSRHWCSLCYKDHLPVCEGAERKGGYQWKFNGNWEKPTFEPSLVNYGHPHCHLNLQDGILKYCGDSHHSLSGKQIPLEPVDF